jgi:hypothetical protein
MRLRAFKNRGFLDEEPVEPDGHVGCRLDMDCNPRVQYASSISDVANHMPYPGPCHRSSR